MLKVGKMLLKWNENEKTVMVQRSEEFHNEEPNDYVEVEDKLEKVGVEEESDKMEE